MNEQSGVIETENLVRRFGPHDAVDGLTLNVRPGACYGFFGRNGAGKTTTIKCLLNLLRPTSGKVRVLGADPQKDDAGLKGRMSYVPDAVAFYPWMTVRQTLDYFASFRSHWNRKIEQELLGQFRLAETKRVASLSKGQRTQLALVSAIAPEPELLILDEPTSGLDPVVRREFIQTVIGAYQDAAPGKRTIFISTHLITEFEGLIDEFTIIEQGKEVLTMQADAARESFQRIRTRFVQDAPEVDVPGAVRKSRNGRLLETIVRGNIEPALARLRALSPADLAVESLSLEEIFMVSVN